MKTRFIITALILFASAFAQASLPKNLWQRIENPGVDAFYSNNEAREYLTVAKNQSDEKMSFAGQDEAEITHVLTLLRRVSLEQFGIKAWTISSLKKARYKHFEVIQIKGTYVNKKQEVVTFAENMYFAGQKFTQLSWIQIGGVKSIPESVVQANFQELEKDYL